jgi:hypothetical protein
VNDEFVVTTVGGNVPCAIMWPCGSSFGNSGCLIWKVTVSSVLLLLTLLGRQLVTIFTAQNRVMVRSAGSLNDP